MIIDGHYAEDGAGMLVPPTLVWVGQGRLPRGIGITELRDVPSE